MTEASGVDALPSKSGVLGQGRSERRDLSPFAGWEESFEQTVAQYEARRATADDGGSETPLTVADAAVADGTDTGVSRDAQKREIARRKRQKELAETARILGSRSSGGARRAAADPQLDRGSRVAGSFDRPGAEPEKTVATPQAEAGAPVAPQGLGEPDQSEASGRIDGTPPDIGSLGVGADARGESTLFEGHDPGPLLESGELRLVSAPLPFEVERAPVSDGRLLVSRWLIGASALLLVGAGAVFMVEDLRGVWFSSGVKPLETTVVSGLATPPLWVGSAVDAPVAAPGAAVVGAVAEAPAGLTAVPSIAPDVTTSSPAKDVSLRGAATQMQPLPAIPSMITPVIAMRRVVGLAGQDVEAATAAAQGTAPGLPPQPAPAARPAAAQAIAETAPDAIDATETARAVSAKQPALPAQTGSLVARAVEARGGGTVRPAPSTAPTGAGPLELAPGEALAARSVSAPAGVVGQTAGEAVMPDMSVGVAPVGVADEDGVSLARAATHGIESAQHGLVPAVAASGAGPLRSTTIQTFAGSIGGGRLASVARATLLEPRLTTPAAMVSPHRAGAAENAIAPLTRSADTVRVDRAGGGGLAGVAVIAGPAALAEPVLPAKGVTGDVLLASAARAAQVPDPGVLEGVVVSLPGTAQAASGARVSLFAPGSLTETDVGAVVATLAASGIEPPNPSRVGFSISQSNVRYYHGEDAAAAAAVAEASGALLRDFTGSGSSVPPGTIELWLAGDGTGATPVRARPAAKKTAAKKPAAKKTVKRQPAAPPAAARTNRLRSQVINKLRSATRQ